MKNAVIFLADGFEEIEVSIPYDLLMRAGINVVFAGINGEVCTGAHGLKIFTDMAVSYVKDTDFDVFICPGGAGADKLKNDNRVLDIMEKAYNSGKYVAAICAAPLVLHKIGILKGKNFTMYPSMKNLINEGNYIDTHTVTDGNIITGAGPAAAFEFALAIISVLVGEKIAKEVATATLYCK